MTTQDNCEIHQSKKKPGILSLLEAIITIVATFMLVIPLIAIPATPYNILTACLLGIVYVLLGQYGCRSVLTWLGYSFLVASLIATAYQYVLLPLPFIQRLDIFGYTFLLGGMTLQFLFLYLALRIRKECCTHHTLLKLAVGPVVLALLFLWIRLYLIFIAHYVQLVAELRQSSVRTIVEFVVSRQWEMPLSVTAPSTRILLMAYDALSSLYFIMGGFAYQKRAIRFAGYALLLLAVLQGSLLFFSSHL